MTYPGILGNKVVWNWGGGFVPPLFLGNYCTNHPEILHNYCLDLSEVLYLGRGQKYPDIPRKKSGNSFSGIFQNARNFGNFCKLIDEY